jgi:hypothetical protein
VGVWTKDDESVGVSAKKLSEQVGAYGAWSIVLILDDPVEEQREPAQRT